MASTSRYEETRPLSIKELGQKAAEFEWDPSISFRHWARAAEAIHHEGQVYFQEGNVAHAYVVLQRYAVLVIEKLSKHPEAKTPEARKALKPLVGRIDNVLRILESMKPGLEQSYNEWIKVHAARRDNDAGARNRSGSSSYAKHAARDVALSWNHASPANILDASEHPELAVDLAKKEITRRRRMAGLTDEEVSRRRAAGFWDKAAASRYMDDEELRRQMESTRRQLDRSTAARDDDDEQNSRPASVNYHYPSINKSAPVSYSSSTPRTSASRDEPKVQPARPPKESLNKAWPAITSAPPLPDKEPLARDLPPPYDPPKQDLPPLPPKSSPESTAKQRRITFRPAAYLENGDPIRPVFLPSSLRQAFLEMAADNTRRNLEMCGILCGTLVNNALFVSCLLIPEQKCTSDTCETENENAMLEYCITNDLLIVGWIHTHPTQTCFMSSRDLHTQAGYQVMMPESIAIVCAPRHKPSWGIFRLTNPPGLPHILACNHNDTFHQHSIDNIYTDAGQPGGHVIESSKLDFEVTDLRPKR